MHIKLRSGTLFKRAFLMRGFDDTEASPPTSLLGRLGKSVSIVFVDGVSDYEHLKCSGSLNVCNAHNLKD